MVALCLSFSVFLSLSLSLSLSLALSLCPTHPPSPSLSYHGEKEDGGVVARTRVTGPI